MRVAGHAHRSAFVAGCGLDSMNAGTGYEWTQTKEELTMFIMLPAGCGARDLVVRVAEGSVSISLKQYGTGQPLVSGTLSEAIAGSVWSVESGVLSLELEKARPRFWTCALRGDPEVDVQALVAKEKRDQEPPYKLPPDADAIPRQVTDRETLRKLKAEFPQLELPIANAHTATHQNFAGKRSAFEWGALPTEDDQARPSPPPSTTAPATGRRTLSSVRAPMQQAATAQKCVDSQPTDATKYSWGSLPSETAGLGGGGDGMYSWGALPSNVSASTSPSSASPLPPTSAPPTLHHSQFPTHAEGMQHLKLQDDAPRPSKMGTDLDATPLPLEDPQVQMYSWGPLPTID